MTLPVTLADVEAACVRLRGVVHETPLLRSTAAGTHVGATVYWKCENLQRVGAFKARGAFNKITALGRKDRARGVITYSSGNHAQATALAARHFGVPCVVTMPEDAPPPKVAAVRGYGAEVVFAGTVSEARKAKAVAIAAERGLAMVPPFDDPFVIAGQGTVAVEILAQNPAIDIILVPIGGGGLIAGIAVVAKALKPTIRVIGVEPEAACSSYKSRQAGRIVAETPGKTIADGLKPVSPGELNFAIMEALVDDIVLVTEAEIAAATQLIFESGRLVAEPSGAASTAALLSLRPQWAGKTIAAVISGGNIDFAAMRGVLPFLSA